VGQGFDDRYFGAVGAEEVAELNADGAAADDSD
jgi:hypothetical protein